MTSEIVGMLIDDYLRISASQRDGDGISPELLGAADLITEAAKLYPDGNPSVIAYVATRLEVNGEEVGPIVVGVLKNLAGK